MHWRFHKQKFEVNNGWFSYDTRSVGYIKDIRFKQAGRGEILDHAVTYVYNLTTAYDIGKVLIDSSFGVGIGLIRESWK